MELKDFIKTSLTEICLAIDEANDELNDSEAVINPSRIKINSESSQAYGRQTNQPLNKMHKVVQKIDFDVAVYAQEAEKTGGGAKISIASIGIGVNAETATTNKSETRLKFSIPVIYPEGHA